MTYKNNDAYALALKPLRDIINSVAIKLNMRNASGSDSDIKAATINQHSFFNDDFGMSLKIIIKTRMNILNGVRYPQKHFISFKFHGPTERVEYFSKDMPEYIFETESDIITNKELEQFSQEYSKFLSTLIDFRKEKIQMYAIDNYEADETLIKYLPEDIQEMFLF